MRKIAAMGGLFGSLVFVIAACSMDLAPVVSAATTPTTISVQQTPAPSGAPAIIISSLAGSALPDYIELFNQADQPINLAEWKITFTVHDSGAPACADQTVVVPLPAAWMLSEKYLTLQRGVTADNGIVPFQVSDTLLAGCIAPKLTSVVIVDPASAPEQTVTIPAAEWSNTTTAVAQHKQRGNALSSTRSVSGVFDTDYKLVTGAVALNSDPLYIPPVDAAGLQILEILPNARDCSPLETDLTCNDYVKFYNPTDQPINLALYRLRIAAKGQAESTTNTFTWGRMLNPTTDELLLPPQTYSIVTTRNDGQPLSITDGGNYAWLEDAYGTTLYEPIVQYPDASSTTKVGWAWAYDGASWQWTSAPRPNTANYFPPPVVLSDSTAAPTITTVFKPCAENQFRNPETNRCNTITATLSTLAPCDVGEERNPATNRCRAIITTATSLTPCQAGSERSPDTNRCRKVTLATQASTVKDVATPTVNNTGWFVAVLAVGLAASYGIYEWRQEIRVLGSKLRTAVIQLPKRLRRHT